MIQQPEHVQRGVATKAVKQAAVFAEQEATVLRLIEQAARLGNECPSNGRLAQACGMKSPSGGGNIMARLAAQGVIEVHGTQNARVVKIVALGLRTAGQLTGRAAEQVLIDMIASAATRGETCPSNNVMAGALGVSPQSVINMMKRMEDAGRIRVRRSSQSRIVTIVETGATTAGVIRTERSYAGRKITSPKARFAKEMAEAVHTNDLKVPCARAGILSLAEGERLFAEICADLGDQAQ
jgi:DNA-binding MarR family transcriptional regulator